MPARGKRKTKVDWLSNARLANINFARKKKLPHRHHTGEPNEHTFTWTSHKPRIWQSFMEPTEVDNVETVSLGRKTLRRVTLQSSSRIQNPYSAIFE